MAITADRLYQSVAGATERADGLAAAGNTIYKGSLLVWASGLLEPGSDAVGKTFAGVALRNNSPSFGPTAVTLATDRLEYETGKLWIPDAAAAQTDVGQLLYVADNGSLVLTGASVKKVIAGRCIDYKEEDGQKWRLLDTTDTAATTGA